MRGLLPFLISRIVRAAVALWLVSTVVFVVMRLSGDPVPLLLPPEAPRSEIFRVRAELGLDRPLPVQYAIFLGNALRGDFGRSIHFRQPAFRVVLGYLPATFELGLSAFALALVVAVPVGVVSAMRRNSVVDQAAMGLALVGQAAPTFFIGILLILIVSLKLGLLPTSGRGDWRYLVLPALTLGAFAMASIARLTRSAVLEVLRADYIRTARAKGLAETLVVAKHTLKNAARPDRDDHRPAVRHPARRGGGDGNGVRVAGHRTARHPVDLQSRLPDRAVHGVPLGRALHRDQLLYRPDLWSPRSPRPFELTRRRPARGRRTPVARAGPAGWCSAGARSSCCWW